jgi:hypothetical protein
MLGNTLDLTIGGATITMVKINQDAYSSEYMFRNATHQYTAKVRHSRTKQSGVQPSYDRHNFEVVVLTFASGETAESYQKFYFVMEQHASNTSVAMPDAVADLLIASSNAFLVSLLGWES